MSTSEISMPGANRHGNWHSFDAPYERLKLFSPAVIAGFGLAVGFGLVLAYPHHDLEQRLASENAPADSLTVEYLKAFIRAEPDADGLRLALAKRLLRLGSYGEARAALAPLRQAGDPEHRVRAGMLELEMLAQEAFALPSDNPSREMRRQRAAAQLRTMLAAPLTSAQLVQAGRTALALGESEAAADAFGRVAAGNAEMPADFYAEAAAVMLGLGDYRACAELYFLAMRASTGLPLQRRYFLQGLQALQAGSLFDDALRAAERHLGPLSNDAETLTFLTRLAQAANRPDAAERYVRRLLRLSLLRMAPGVAASVANLAPATRQSPLEFYLAALDGDAQDGAPARLLPVAQGGAEPGLPFDEAAYSLGYEVFLANRNLADAHRLALSAVRQRPDAPHWRKRLAEVSEWQGLPQEGLKNWLAYARLTRDEAGWDNALRLAQSLFDQDALQKVLEHKLAAAPDRQEWLDRLLAVHEANGEPERVLQLLHSRLSGARGNAMPPQQRRRELELLAATALRAGHDSEALRTWRTLQEEFGPSGAYALQIANQLYRQGQVSQAYAALQQGLADASTDNADFWRAYAEVARLLQYDDAARRGYLKLLELDRQSEADLANLIALLDDQPRAAAQLAEFAYDKTGDPNFLAQALSFHNRSGDRDAAGRLLARLPEERQLALARHAGFLAARAALRQAEGNPSGALRDYRAALEVSPGDVNLRAGLIWTAIAARDAPTLQRALTQWAAEAETTPDLWGPFAAASMSLNRQHQALHWFRKSGFQRDDYLWLMSYAEALDATAQPELAWRIRRKAWQDLRRPEVLARIHPDQLLAARDRLAASAPLFMGGDGASRVMAALLRADARKLSQHPAAGETPKDGKELLQRLSAVIDAPAAEVEGIPEPHVASLFAPGSGRRPQDDARLSATVRELALAYALNRNAHDLARAWLASRYARQLDKPLWGELSLLLMSDERDKLDRLLDEMPDWLPMYDRIEAAQRAGRPALAQTLAFDQLARLPHDEELHARFTRLATEEPARFQASVATIKEGALETRASRADTTLNLATGLRLTLALKQNRHRTVDTGQLGAVPARDDEAVLVLRKRIETGYLQAGINRRNAAAGTTGLRLEYRLAPASRVSIAGSAGRRQPASESALLRAGAWRSGTEHTLTYAFTRTEYGSIGISWYRYASQLGTVLGNGRGVQAELGSHLRLEYPNITLRASLAHNSYDASGLFDSQIAQLAPAGSDPAAFAYLPAGATVFGLSLGLGTVVENAYSRGWRPFAEVGLTYGAEQGVSYNLRGGLAGSVFGQDTLLLRLQSNGASAERPQGLQEIGLYYQWLY